MAMTTARQLREAALGLVQAEETTDDQERPTFTVNGRVSRAPQELVDTAAAAATAKPGEVGDLPRAIGRPATRALADLGVTTLAQVAVMPRDDLLAIHGVGPKAVRVLDEALASGRSS
jgi:predicted flap endonuclease-1-like 5' DNA nuclease